MGVWSTQIGRAIAAGPLNLFLSACFSKLPLAVNDRRVRLLIEVGFPSAYISSFFGNENGIGVFIFYFMLSKPLYILSVLVLCISLYLGTFGYDCFSSSKVMSHVTRTSFI